MSTRWRARLSALAFSIGLAGCAGRPSRPNVLLISIDALRADSVGAYGYSRSTTPFLDLLAARGQRFTRAYIPLPATAPSHATLLTSLHPAQHGVLANTMALPDQAETLAEVLRANGYVTLGAVAVFYLKGRYGFGQGFDAFSDAWDVQAKGNSPTRRAAADVNRSVFTMLSSLTKQRRDQPVFLFVHYYDVHAPYVRRPRYSAPEPVLRSPTGSEGDSAREMVDAYDSGVRYVDEQIRQLYGRLEELGFARKLLVCVTSDHGEQLGEHGYVRGHADIYGETIRVPLVVEGPGVPQGAVDEPVSSMDVAVSILAQLGLRFSGAAGAASPETGGAIPWGAAGPRSRPFLVLGYPGHTHSLALIQDDLWYIRNLDSLYKEVLIEQPSPRTSQLPPDFRPARRMGAATDAVYVTEAPASSGKVTAIQVTIDVRLEPLSCLGKLSLGLGNRLRYLNKPLPVKGAIRVHVPATSRDRIAVFLQGEGCPAEIAYRVMGREAFEQERSGSAGMLRAIETDLWRRLLSKRKARRGDELYDVRADPAMLANLLDAGGHRETALHLDALIDRLWGAYERRALAAQAVSAETSEEREALRSLGYVR